MAGKSIVIRSRANVGRSRALLRVAVALVMLVAWSPAWCCCGIRSALTWANGAFAVAETPAPMCPYCAGAATTVESSTTPPRGPDHGPCHCHDQGREATAKAGDVPSVVGAASAAPAWLVALPSALAMMPWSADAGCSSFGAMARGAPPRPAQSLLTLHCMLTT